MAYRRRRSFRRYIRRARPRLRGRMRLRRRRRSRSRRMPTIGYRM